MRELKVLLGRLPDLDLLKKIYDFEFEHTPLEEHEEEHNSYSIHVDGVKVRFLEEHYCLKITIEGNLIDSKIEHIKESLTTKLSKLENTPYLAETY